MNGPDSHEPADAPQAPDQNTTPTPDSPRTAPPPKDLDFRWMTDFFKSSGGSVLFCLSALSIFAGLSSIVGPILGSSYALRKTLPAIGTIGVYELSLFGVLCALVLRWRVTRDAVSLVALVGIFLVTLGMLVSTVANDNPGAVSAVGAAAGLAAVAQLITLRRRVGVPFTLLMSTGLALLLGWNCLNASALAWYIDQDSVTRVRTLWPMSSTSLLAATALLYIAALTTHTGMLEEFSRGREFLRAPGMAWLFAAILVAGSAIHQYATRYVFDLPFYLIDYVPLIGLAAFTALEIIRGYGRSRAFHQLSIGAIPLAALVLAVASKSYDVEAGLGAGLLARGATTFAFVALIAILSAVRARNRELMLLAAAHIFALVLLAFPRSHATDGVQHINWTLIQAGAAAVVVVTLLIYRVPVFWLATLIAGVLWLPTSETFRNYADYDSMSDPRQVALLAFVYGLGTIVIAAVFGKECPRLITTTGTAGIALSGFVHVSDATALQLVAIAAGLIATGTIVAWRTRDWLAPGVLTTPLAFATYRALEEAQGWRYMLLGFLLLGAGAAWSVRSHGRAQLPSGESPQDTAAG